MKGKHIHILTFTLHSYLKILFFMIELTLKYTLIPHNHTYILLCFVSYRTMNVRTLNKSPNKMSSNGREKERGRDREREREKEL